MKKKIAAFKIGRGGRFFNPGHLKFLGFKPIGELTNDLFIGYKNQDKVFAEIGENRPNLLSLYYLGTADGEEAENARLKLKKVGLNLGESVYFDWNGNPVGLTMAEAITGIGRIDIDGIYNTIYTTFADNLTDQETAAILREEAEI